MKKWEQFSKEEIEQSVKESRRYAQLAEKLGYCTTSGSYLSSMKSMIVQLSLDISHFTGQGWNKDNFDYSRFKFGKRIPSGTALNAIAAIRGRKCECCGFTEWNQMPIPLQVHHLDGDNLNNELSNLQLLCPNCHAQTDSYCGKNKEKKHISDEEFVNALRESENVYKALVKLNNTQGRIYERAYKLIDEYNITMKHAKNNK